jgi:hypothetical protein
VLYGFSSNFKTYKYIKHWGLEMLRFEAFTVDKMCTVVFWVMTHTHTHTHTHARAHVAVLQRSAQQWFYTAGKELQNTSSMAQPSEQQIIPSRDQTKNVYPLIIFYHILHQKKISNYLKY